MGEAEDREAGSDCRLLQRAVARTGMSRGDGVRCGVDTSPSAPSPGGEDALQMGHYFPARRAVVLGHSLATNAPAARSLHTMSGAAWLFRPPGDDLKTVF